MVFAQDGDEMIQNKIAAAQVAYQSWRMLSIEERAFFLRKVAELLEERKEEYARMMAHEMGRPLTAGMGEITKCAWVCSYYADNAKGLLEQEIVVTDAQKSYVRFDPLGIVLAVMPWNFPFWQVLRFAAPALMAGNVALLKHASNVPQCAQAIEAVFRDAGCSMGVFQNIFLPASHVDAIIADPRIVAVTLTGSEKAGSSVASAAGKNIKKAVLELGGSDPFLVFSDCDLAVVAKVGATARLQNAGQTCVAAKRFVLHESIAEQFTELLKKNFEEYRVGDPLDEDTQMGPLSSKTILEELERQVEESVQKGARIVTGGSRLSRPGYFYPPTILTNVRPGMPAYDEELFGPVAAIIVGRDEDDMVRIANDTRYGLGASVWTQDIEKAERIAGRIEAGCVAINSMVKSDPRLPFGGIKSSGYGRELAGYGIREFVNIKTVVIG